MYNKLFTKILDSSIWLESKSTRVVWVTFIAVMDEAGFAQFATVENLARRANVTLTEATKAIETLEGPDPNSSDPDHEGRRLERVPGGWLVLNAEKYRKLVSSQIIREQTRERVRRHREKRRTAPGGNADSNAAVTPSEAGVQARARVQADGTAAPPVTVDPPDARSKRPIFKGQRFVVFEWMLDDLRRLLGPRFEDFDLHAWFSDLDGRALEDGVTVPQRDGGKWLQEQTLAEIERRDEAARPAPVDWWDECKALHGGACEERMRHHLRMKTDELKAST